MQFKQYLLIQKFLYRLPHSHNIIFQESFSSQISLSFDRTMFLCGEVQLTSVTQSCPTLCDPMNHSTPGLPVHHQLPESTQAHVHWAVMPSSYLILCCPLLLLPSIFPSIRVFSSELALLIRWPKYWSFSFSISPSNEYSGWISFRLDWLISLLSKGLSRVFSSTTV